MADDADVYATPDDLAARWHPLTDAERTKAQALLEDASDFIRTQVGDVSGIPAATLKRVACAVVKRAMVSDAMAGATSHSETVGPVSESFGYSHPAGGMWLTDEDKQALGIGGGRMISIDMDSGDAA